MRKEAAMRWQKSEYAEINMSAEIGGYQDDFEERGPVDPPIQRPATDSPPNEGC
jgi:hypothetical protein